MDQDATYCRKCNKRLPRFNTTGECLRHKNEPAAERGRETAAEKNQEATVKGKYEPATPRRPATKHRQIVVIDPRDSMRVKEINLETATSADTGKLLLRLDSDPVGAFQIALLLLNLAALTHNGTSLWDD